MTPYEIVPSLFQVVILPMCEGIAVGLLVGIVLTWTMKLVERFFAEADGPLPLSSPKVIAPRPPARPPRPPRLQPAGRLPLAKAW